MFVVLHLRAQFFDVLRLLECYTYMKLGIIGRIKEKRIWLLKSRFSKRISNLECKWIYHSQNDFFEKVEFMESLNLPSERPTEFQIVMFVCYFILHNRPIRSGNQFAFRNKFCTRYWLYKSQPFYFIERLFFFLTDVDY